MKHTRLTRRQLFKLTALGIGALALPGRALASVAAPPPPEAQASAQQSNNLAIQQPAFNTIASTTAFGAPTDLSMGWDGTLWAIDASGAPHIYDPIGNLWQPHGESLSATAWVGSTYYWFFGDAVVTAPFSGAVSAPQSIGTLWPMLPDSFKYSVCGAANLNGTLILFHAGRYTDASSGATPTLLTSLSNWPQTANWPMA